MSSLAFPNIFNSATTNVIFDKEACIQNLKLALYSNKLELFGDPYFGTNLREYTFAQNDVFFADMVTDMVIETAARIVPQMLIKRKNVTIKVDGDKLYITLLAQWSNDASFDTINIDMIIRGE